MAPSGCTSPRAGCASSPPEEWRPCPHLDSLAVPSFRPAYLICGDDHGRIAERRARLRAMAERESGASGVELLEGEGARPGGAAGALTAMPFALGRRFVIADGVECWKEADIEPVAAAMRDLDSLELTVAFFAREDARLKAPKALHEAV